MRYYKTCQLEKKDTRGRGSSMMTRGTRDFINRARKTRRRSEKRDDVNDDDALDRPDRAYRGTDDDERLEHVARSKYWVVYRFGNLYRKREVELWESFLILSP